MKESDITHIVEEVLRRLERRGPLSAAPSTRPVLTQRVITLETLEGKLQGTHEITTRPDAVVTPAARDALREHGVRLIRQDRTDCAALPAILVHSSGSDLPSRLPQGNRIASHRANSLDAAIDLLDRHLQPPTRGVLETQTPALGVHLLGQRLGARAFTARDIEDVRRAEESLQPNVLVLDRNHTQRSVSLIQAFISAGRD